MNCRALAVSFVLVLFFSIKLFFEIIVVVHVV
jgi:hypothetical protein